MSPLLRKLDAWDAIVSVSIRTGFADLTSNTAQFPEIAAAAARLYGGATLGDLAGKVSAMLSPCAEGSGGGGAEVALPPGEAPCVSWERHAGSGFAPTFPAALAQCGAEWQRDAFLEPPVKMEGALGAYLECAGACKVGRGGNTPTSL